MLKVIIERWIDSAKEQTYRELLVETRQAALNAGGYVCGESLRDMEDDEHWVVISTWESKTAWESWASSPDRKALLQRMGDFLLEPEKITLLEMLQHN